MHWRGASHPMMRHPLREELPPPTPPRWPVLFVELETEYWGRRVMRRTDSDSAKVGQRSSRQWTECTHLPGRQPHRDSLESVQC